MRFNHSHIFLSSETQPTTLLELIQILDFSRRLVRPAAILAILAVVLLVSFAPAQSAAGSERYVSPNGSNTTNDCSASAAPCQTIAHALVQSNPGDTILLDPGFYYEHLTIDKSIRIVANPDRRCPYFRLLPGFPPKLDIVPCPTIDGSDTGRVINVTNPSATVNLEKIIITNGAVIDENGAGILNYATLTLDDVTVYDNHVLSPDAYTESGGGIANADSGVLLIRNSDVYNNSAYDGGGIYFPSGSLTIQNSEIYSNSAQRFGGGIAVPYGTASTIENTSIRGNTSTNADSNGGGMFIGDGGHPKTSGMHVFNNVTISGYSSTQGTGGLYSTVHVELNHCTLAMNSGPNYTELYLQESQAPEKPHSEIYSTIISNPSIMPIMDLCEIEDFDTEPFFLSGGGNVSDDSSCGFTFMMDQQNTDPGLLPLGNYGGPVWTHALPAGSPAIDNGSLYPHGVDARGVPVQDGDFDGVIQGDSGAYEYEPEHIFIPLVNR